MPNFHTHWLVALKALDSGPAYIQAGYQDYLDASLAYRSSLQKALLEAARLAISTNTFLIRMKKAHEDWRESVLTKKDHDPDAIVCFSAYMLGACGPDFWTLPSVSVNGIIPDFGSAHFDLGHYNRTHRQFEVSVARIGKRDDLQARVEKSYFMGMATHFAADLVIHQLVNISAGAYNLLKKTWLNEQPYAHSWLDKFTTDKLALWSMHNKVEHFWDSYVRSCWLGDFGPLWHEETGAGWGSFQALGLPTLDALYRDLEKIEFKDEKVRANIKRALNTNAAKWALERPLAFPWVFCDRLLLKEPNAPGKLEPFIYDVVVHGKSGAYPDSDLCTKAVNEKDGYQMTDPFHPQTRRSERRKLLFFSSRANDGVPLPMTYHSEWRSVSTDFSPGGRGDEHSVVQVKDFAEYQGFEPTTWNFLTYTVCPDLDKVAKFGHDVFYHLDALGAFVSGAGELGKEFVKSLASAYEQGNPGALGPLANFWNLDTGLGLKVRKIESQTTREVITQLDFVHVFDVAGGGRPSYQRSARYTESMTAPLAYESQEKALRLKGAPAFPVRSQEEAEKLRFENFRSAFEPDDKAFLDRIRVVEAYRSRERRPDQPAFGEFFNGRNDQAASLQPVSFPVRTATLKPLNKFVVLDIKHRLTLELRVSIADFGDPLARSSSEKLGMFFVADCSHGVGDAARGETEKWLEKKAKTLDDAQVPQESARGLQCFSTRLLVNFENEKDFKREVKRGIWNNVVPYETNKNHYGRNFAIGTGRKYVLHPTVEPGFYPWPGKHSGKQFDPHNQLTCYSDLSPTEQVFFTVFPLVKAPDGHVFDMLSKEKVKAEQLDDIKRIDAVGFVKIVLFYQFGPTGALQLDSCFIDGLKAQASCSPE